MFPYILADVTKGSRDAKTDSAQAKQLFNLRQQRKADSTRYAALWAGYTVKSHQLADVQVLTSDYLERWCLFCRRKQLRELRRKLE